MDRRYVRKLLALSCCANVVLCLLIIYNCDTLPSDIIYPHTPGAKSPPFFNDNDISTKSRVSSSNDALPKSKTVHSSLGNQTSSKEKLNSKRVMMMMNETSYDPAFGLRHHTRTLPPRDVRELFRRAVPNMAFYVWCGEGQTFLYKHFVSVYLIWYYLEPDVIEIHYEFPPLEDRYNTWLSWLQSNIPSFSLHPLPSHATGSRCGARFGLEILADRGGLFLDNGVTLHTASRDNMYVVLTSIRSFSFFQDGALAWAAARKHDPAVKSFLSLSELQQDSQKKNMSNYFQSQANEYKYKDIRCKDQITLNELKQHDLGNDTSVLNNTLSHPQADDKHVYCLRLQNNIHPVDILKAESGSVVRNILHALYGDNSSNQTQNKKNDIITSNIKDSKNIPSIVHYIWFGRTNLTLSMYLSFLSSAHLVQPEAIVIHSDLKLYGKYWNRMMKHPNVHVVYREAPYYIYNHKVLYTQHRSDVVRADVLDKYGGIYLDWDAMWLKSPSDLLLSNSNSNNYDIILSRDHMPRPPFPDSINMGVALSKPRSKFIEAWRAAWVHYKSDKFLYNAVELPYKIYELFPHSSWLHDRLQVMCYFLKCHPLFHPDHKHWGKAQPFDWSRDVYSIHFTHPDPPDFHNETALMSGQGMFADIGRFIWDLSRNKTSQLHPSQPP